MRTTCIDPDKPESTCVNLPSEYIQAADRMAVQKHLPEFIAKTVAVSMRDLAENNAGNTLGNAVISIL